jgi:ribose 5-phosphate isomerase B
MESQIRKNQKGEIGRCTIVIGNDHAGVAFKNKLISHLTSQMFARTHNLQITLLDLGSNSPQSEDDYIDYAQKVCHKLLILQKKIDVAKSSDMAFGILLCRSGSGMCMAANKMSGIRAATCTDSYMATYARKDNDANVLCLRSRKVLITETKRIVDAWFNSSFSGETRHKRRIKKLTLLENELGKKRGSFK